MTDIQRDRITFFVPAKLAWCDDSTLHSETLLAGNLQDGFSVASLESSNSVGEETVETSPWICTWLLWLELRGSEGSQEICLGRSLGVQLWLQQQTQTAAEWSSPLHPPVHPPVHPTWH